MNFKNILSDIYIGMAAQNAGTDTAIAAEESYRAYLDWHGSAFDDNDLSDKAFDIISDLVANAQHLAFERGVKTGAQLCKELFM